MKRSVRSCCILDTWWSVIRSLRWAEAVSAHALDKPVYTTYNTDVGTMSPLFEFSQYTRHWNLDLECLHTAWELEKTRRESTFYVYIYIIYIHIPNFTGHALCIFWQPLYIYIYIREKLILKTTKRFARPQKRTQEREFMRVFYVKLIIFDDPCAKNCLWKRYVSSQKNGRYMQSF